MNISGVVSSHGNATSALPSLSGTIHIYTVLKDAAGNTSAPSSVLTLTVINSVPPVPTLSIIKDTSHNAICSISGQLDTSYILYNGNTILASGIMTSTPLIVNYRMTAGKIYKFRTILKNIVGFSAYSSITTITG